MSSPSNFPGLLTVPQMNTQGLLGPSIPAGAMGMGFPSQNAQGGFQIAPPPSMNIPQTPTVAPPSPSAPLNSSGNLFMDFMNGKYAPDQVLNDSALGARVARDQQTALMQGLWSPYQVGQGGVF